MNNYNLHDLIKYLKLEPLVNEGGLIATPYRSDEYVKDKEFINREGERPIMGTIYYLLTKNAFSKMHKLVSDEIYFYHYGAPLKMLIIDEINKTYEIKLLGMNLEKGERPQITVKRNCYQGSLIDGNLEYGLYSTSMAPSYLDCDFKEGTYEDLKQYVNSSDQELLKHLCGKPVYY